MSRPAGWCKLLLGMLLLGPVPLLAQEAPSGKPLLWGADEEGGAPYVFPDGDLNRVGYEVDLAAALARELGRPIQFHQTDFDTLIPSLEKRDFDLAMNGLEITPERQEKVRFSRPYYVYRQQLVIRNDETRFSTLKGMKAVPGVVVGTMSGTAAQRLLEKEGFTIKTYPGPTEAYEDLALGRIDGVFFDLPMAQWYVPSKYPTLKHAGRPMAKGYYGIAVHKDDEQLANDIDVALGRMMESGELRRIYKKWGLWDSAQEELMPNNLFEEDDQKEAPTTSGVPIQSSGYQIPNVMVVLLHGAWITVQLAVCSFALAVLLGLPIALARLYGPAWLRGLAIAHIEFYRGIPVLLLLFFLYFGLPVVGRSLGLGEALVLPSFVAAMIGLGLNYSAYEAEIYRSAIQGIPQGQWEAGASLGMSPALTFRRIILPQALRSILPPMTGDFVALFKDTSIASAIALNELNKQYQILSKNSLKFLELGILTAILYLVMSVPLGYLSRYLEKRWSEYAA